MKKDMGGAAVALGARAYVDGAPAFEPSCSILVPAVENAICGNAYRPGDVLSTRKGLTVEVGNTDAEGRLVLCDALALADAEQPDLIIDFATLTGPHASLWDPSCRRCSARTSGSWRISLGPPPWSTTRLWPMPLWMGYDDELGSKIADLNNVASSGLAGAIFGALFLKRFVTATAHWLHLDSVRLESQGPARPRGRRRGPRRSRRVSLFVATLRYAVTMKKKTTAPQDAGKSGPIDTRRYSRLVVDGIKQAPARAMLHAVGFGEADFDKPQVGIASTWSNLTPCNMHIDGLARLAAQGVEAHGAKAVTFNTITVSDGISMGTPGMRYSLVSREVIADSIETVVGAQGFDGVVAFGGCDKNMPGCLMALARLDRPAIFVYGGTIRPGAERRDIVSVFEAIGGHAKGTVSETQLKYHRAHRDSRPRVVRGHVHGQHHGLRHRSAGDESPQQLRAGCDLRPQARGLHARRRGRGGAHQARHPAAADHDAQGVRERHHREHRARRLDQRRAAPAGDRLVG